MARYPLLEEAIRSTQVGNVASFGGNLLQEVRCHWLVAPNAACARRQSDSRCSEIFLREDGIFGSQSRCKAAYPSDLCVALMSLDAHVECQSLTAVRVLPLDEFLLLPTNAPNLTNALMLGEMVIALILGR